MYANWRLLQNVLLHAYSADFCRDGEEMWHFFNHSQQPHSFGSLLTKGRSTTSTVSQCWSIGGLTVIVPWPLCQTDLFIFQNIIIISSLWFISLRGIVTQIPFGFWKRSDFLTAVVDIISSTWWPDLKNLSVHVYISSLVLLRDFAYINSHYINAALTVHSTFIWRYQDNCF